MTKKVFEGIDCVKSIW